MNDADLAELRRARDLLEHPGLAMKLANLAGKPAAWAISRLPGPVGEVVARATRVALDRALDLAVYSLGERRGSSPRDWQHRMAVWASGATGGAFGLLALPIELPVSTTLMLRSIAEHALAQGEDLSTAEARMNCLLVLALGSSSRAASAPETGYFAVRMAFARTVSLAAEYVAGRLAAEEAAEKTSPALVRLVSSIAARFGVAVQDKAMAQLVPLFGAAGGALINQVFVAHFQAVAQGHFTVRRLERKHGRDEVHRAFQAP